MAAEIGAVPASVILVTCIIALTWWRRRGVPTKRDIGWLYFIGNGEGPIKVGITRGDPKDRCRDLQTGNPQKLKVLYSMPTYNPEMMEAHVHDMLGDFHVGGEWYQRDAVQFLIDELRGKNVVPINRARGTG